MLCISIALLDRRTLYISRADLVPFLVPCIVCTLASAFQIEQGPIREPSTAMDAQAAPSGSVASVGAFANDVLYGARASIGERFPGLSGVLLWNQVRLAYNLKVNQTLKYFDSKGERTPSYPCLRTDSSSCLVFPLTPKQHQDNEKLKVLLQCVRMCVPLAEQPATRVLILPPLHCNTVAVAQPRALHRHKLNMRDVQAVEEDFADGILEAGVLPHMRGCVIAVETETPEHLGIAAGGSLANSFYIAHAKEPNNEFVKASRSMDVENAIIVGKQTPPDVIAWLITEANNYHKGGDNSFVTLVESVDQIEGRWRNHCTVTGTTVRSCPTSGENTYEKQQWRWVQKD